MIWQTIGTEISFELPRKMDATLTFYNMDGKILKVVNLKAQEGMNYISVFNTDLNTQGLIYYQLDALDYSATKKMLIMK